MYMYNVLSLIVTTEFLFLDQVYFDKGNQITEHLQKQMMISQFKSIIYSHSTHMGLFSLNT